MPKLDCVCAQRGVSGPCSVSVEKEGLTVAQQGNSRFVDYADVCDFRLLNYHFHLYLPREEIVFSMLGRQTEDFFEKIWLAYGARAREALFLSGSPVQECEGDYAYTEGETSRSSIAKIALYPDCLCILPHDAGARRVPLCFAAPPVCDRFSLSLTLDTGERYRLSRLGHMMTPFFEKTAKFRENTVRTWTGAHQRLQAEFFDRLGERKDRYDVLASCGAQMRFGLFSAEDDAFWYAAIGKDRAAVELVIGESAATYLYRFGGSPDAFGRSLSHAMEAAGSHREVIYTPEDELADKPLIRMAVQRSSHIRFLRSSAAGRLMHTSGWPEKVRGFFDAPSSKG